MLRLLGILALGNLLFGGRRGRRALRRGLFLGGLLGYFASRNFDTERVKEDVQNAAHTVRRAAHDAEKAVRREVHDARRAAHRQEVEERLEEIRARAEARRAARSEVKAPTVPLARTSPKAPIAALPASAAPILDDSKNLVEELERNARTAAMAADVPVIEFPEEDDRYFSAKKYGYA